ncbi:MAG: hypothetical protein IJ680_06340, partial [Paludibacteraceae bacterium]|nr:hypothetical protein [Paludibacteraceae bacterium]
KKDNSSINKQIKEVNKNKMLDNATRSTQLNGLQQRLTKNDNDDRADEATIQNINREIEKLGETLSKNQKNQIEAQNHLNELNAQLEQNNQKMKLIDGEIKVVKGNIKTEKAAAKAAAKAAK